MLYAQIVRSPHAHAKVVRVHTKAARALPGVVAVFTGKDLEGKVNPIPTAWLIPGSDLKTPPHPALAVDVVRYVGDGVAVVVADSPFAAATARPSCASSTRRCRRSWTRSSAVRDGAPQLHADAPRNVAFTWRVAGGDAEAAFAEAKRDGVVISQRFLNQRLIPNAMETRGTVARYNSGSGDLTVWTTTQNPHIARFLLSVVTGIPEQKIRVIAPEVGGGFGSKIPLYADDAIVVFCSQRDRPPGEVGRGPPRKLSGDDPRPRPHHRRRDRGAQGRDVTGDPRQDVGQPGRLPVDRRPGRPDDPARSDDDGVLRDPEHLLRGARACSRTRSRSTRTAAPAGPRRRT